MCRFFESGIAISEEIIKNDGTSIFADADGDLAMMPVNNFGYASFEEITLEINGTKIDTVGSYAQHAYFDNLLDCSEQEKKALLRGEG